MKELEDDAIRAQAVIVKAQEMQNEAADSRTTNSQNGEPEVSSPVEDGNRPCQKYVILEE